MVLIGEEKQLCFDASQASGIESTHALSRTDAVILLAMNAKDGRIPLVNEAMRRVLIGLTGTVGLVFIPVSVVVLPVGEPVFFSPTDARTLQSSASECERCQRSCFTSNIDT